MPISISTTSSLQQVDRDEWNALRGAAHPFLSHEFLSALEETGCVSADSGWTPCHLLLRTHDGRLVGAMPLYRKLHSWGEFVFDFAWARAHTHYGLEYYPKLLCAVPFTPASGPRLLTGSDEFRLPLIEGALELAREQQLSSFHVLFAEQAQAELLAERGFLLRRDCQFHWHNAGYADFDAFLAGFTAQKRKKVKRERRRIAEAGVSFRTLTGGEIDHGLWRQIYAFHAGTFMRHGHLPYLSCRFFETLAKRMPDRIVVQLAEHQGQPVAAAICFRSDDTLYGRYWGAGEQFDGLHFETCYYQGIDYCIREGLRRFEPGTQGEHKVSRGFVPAYTWSAHWIADPRLRSAIADFVRREASAVQAYADEVGEHIPYKQVVPLPSSRPQGGQP